MKRFRIVTVSVLLMMVMWIMTVPLFSGTYVKGVYNVPGSYRYGKLVPDIDVIYEWWFDKDKLLIKTIGWDLENMDTDYSILLDKRSGTINIINHREKSVLTAKIDQPITRVAPKGFKDRSKNVLYHGTVSPLSKQKKMSGVKAHQMNWHIWLQENQLRARDRKRDLWISSEVPFDWRMHWKVIRWLLDLVNYDEAYPKALRKLHGFILSMDAKILSRGNAKKWRFDVIKMKEQAIKASIFTVPEGYRSKSQLSRDDIWLLRCVFLFPRILR